MKDFREDINRPEVGDDDKYEPDILTDEIRVALRRYFGPTTDRDRQLMEESRVLFERWIKSGTEMTFDEWVKLQPESQLPPEQQAVLDEIREENIQKLLKS